jgi:hypothetical protein
MLPIGHLSLDDRPHGPDRLSRFTWEEHKTLMTLWCIARSPLIMGGDLPSSPEKSLAFLKNSEVLAGLFNLRDRIASVSFDLESDMLRGRHRVRDLWTRQDREPVEGRLSVRLWPHSAGLYRLSPATRPVAGRSGPP